MSGAVQTGTILPASLSTSASEPTGRTSFDAFVSDKDMLTYELPTDEVNEDAHSADRLASIIMNDMLDAENAAQGPTNTLAPLSKSVGDAFLTSENTPTQTRLPVPESFKNINAKFPFKSEIVKSYSKIVKGVLSCLLDPCWDTDDILWACAVSKCIFTACQKCALDSTQKPQRTFQEAVKAGEGADWERTSWEMTKLQRTTRDIVLSDFTGNAVEFWVQSKRTETNGDVARLLSQKDYKPASLEECMYQLLKVSFLLASNLRTRAYLDCLSLGDRF